MYADPGRQESFESRYRATGKRLDMGKSCVRFRSLDDLPLDLVAEVIGATSVDDFLAGCEEAASVRSSGCRRRPRRRCAKSVESGAASTS